MLFDKMLGGLTLLKLQQSITEFGTLNVLLAILAVAATALVLDYGRMLYMRSKMPPGPFPLPIIGNTWSLPDHKPWIWFEEVAKQYNAPLITIWIGR